MSSDDLRFVANQDSLTVHESSCEYADQIAPWNVVWFEHLYDALGHGYRECGYCLSDRPMRLAFSQPRVRALRAKNGCLICGETRAVDMAHIIQRGHGCTTTIELCKTHHWAYDSGTLTDPEFGALVKAVSAKHGRSKAALLAHGHGMVRRA